MGVPPGVQLGIYLDFSTFNCEIFYILHSPLLAPSWMVRDYCVWFDKQSLSYRRGLDRTKYRGVVHMDGHGSGSQGQRAGQARRPGSVELSKVPQRLQSSQMML